MIKTTDAYKEAIKKNRILHHKINIAFPDGSTATAEDAELRSFQIKDNTSNQSSFDIGGAFAKQLTIKLDNMDGKFTDKNFDNAKITAKVGLEISGKTEWLDKGAFYSETGIDTGNVIAINAYDKMINFDRPYSLSKLQYPATLLSIVQDACTCCNVTLAPDSASFPNNGYVVDERPEDSSINFRKVLQWVGQISCTFLTFNDSEQLSLRWYNTDLLESDSIENSKDVVKITDFGAGSSLSTNDVVITGIKVEESGDGTETTYQYGPDGYVLKISDNDLIQNGNGATVSEFVGKKINGLQFRPLALKCQSDPSIEPGDIGLVTDSKGCTHRTIFAAVTYTSYAQQELICGAETPTRLSVTRYSEITKTYKDLRRNLFIQKTEFSKALEDLAEQISNSKGLYPITVKQEDGSSILYFCDTPDLKDAEAVIKLSAAGWAMSSDGGKTWNSGALVDGEMIAKLLKAKGISADWINTGALRVLNKDGKEVLYINAETGEVRATPTLFSLSGKSVADIAGEAVSNFVNTVYKEDLEKLQDQIDGKVEEYYHAYEPTLDNLPASEWKTDEEKKVHEGDRFFDKSTGHAYRFFKNDETGEYEWVQIQDADVVEALNKAAQAQKTADGKRRTFLTTPQPPYDAGDIWMQGSDGDIMVCIKSREKGTAYNSDDWVKSSKYTDDTKADQALKAIDKLKTLSVVLSNENQMISTDADGNCENFPETATTVSAYMGSVDVTDKAVYTVTESPGIIGSWNLFTKTYTVTDLSTDSGYVDVSASYSELKGSRRFTIAKLKAGETGPAGPKGEDGGTWTIDASTNTIKRGEDGTLNPSTVTAKAWYQAGKDVSRTEYIGKLYVYTSPDGSEWTKVSESDTSSSIAYDVSDLADAVYWIRFTLCAAGTDTVIDQQTVQILDDVSSLTGEIMLNKLSGGWQGIYQGEDGKYYMDAEYIRGKTMSAKYLDARNLTVTNNKGAVTLKIDSDGNVDAKLTSLSIAGSSAATQEYVNNTTAAQLKKAKIYANSKTGNLLNGPDLTENDRKEYWNIVGSVTEGQTDPDGGKNAILITGTESDNYISAKYENNNPVRTKGQYEVRIWLRSSAALKTCISFNRTTYEISVTTTWKLYKFSIPITVPSKVGLENFTIGGFGKLVKGNKLYIYKPEVTYSYTPEDILNMLTNNGAADGIFFNGNQLYVKGERISVDDLYAIGATIGGWKINKNNLSSATGNISLTKDGKIKIGSAVLYSAGHAAVIKSGLTIYTDRSNEFSDGTGEFRIYGATSGSGYLLTLSGKDNVVYLQASSSRRYKDHIKDVLPEEAEKLLSLPVVWFRYKDGYLQKNDALYGKSIPGFYAEDVSRLFPECAVYDEEGRPEDWNYRMLIPAMLKLIQNLYKEVRGK